MHGRTAVALVQCEIDVLGNRQHNACDESRSHTRGEIQGRG